VFDKYFSIISDYVSAHKRQAAIIVISLVILSSLGTLFIKYDNNIELMLPKDGAVLLSLRFLRQSHFSDKAIISLGLNSSQQTTAELILAANNLVGQLNSPLILKVSSGIAGNNPQEQINEYLKFAPQLIPPDELAKTDSQLNTVEINKKLGSAYNKLLTPGGSFLMPFIQADPLGIKTGILGNLNQISNAMGYNIIIEDGHFLSRDKKHTFLIVNTNAALTDGFSARKLVNFLKDKLRLLPKYIDADIIAGHMHAVSNEDIIKKDIQRTAGIAMIAFLAVFLFTFRDLRALIFLIIPLGAVVIAMNISALVFGKLSYFIIGLGAVIIGVADDYGIHAYVAVHTSGSKKAINQIAKPLTIAAATTISVFATFFFSSIQGYHQLALFAISSIILCLLFVLLIFPHLLKNKTTPKTIPAQIVKPQAIIPDKLYIWSWILIIIILAGFSFKSRFNSDISQFDASSKDIVKAEDEFNRIYGRGEQPAMLVTSADNLDQALEKNEKLYLQAWPFIGKENLASFSLLWPSLKTRRANALFWEKFWRGRREEELKLLLDQNALQYNFSKDAFQPFFDNLYLGTDPAQSPDNLELFKNIKERFIQKNQVGWQILSFFPDKDEFTAYLVKLSRKIPGTFVVSRKAFSKAISNSITREVIFLSLLAAVLVLALTAVLLKNVKLTLISLVSVVSAIISITGTFSIFGIALNAAAVIASMMVVGLCIDYGVFMLYSFKHELNTGTVKAIWVSALTTLIGAFSLLFARHPVLFSVGLTLVAGLLGGYISSQTVIPALYRVFIEKKTKHK